MKIEEINQCKDKTPVLLRDNKMGLLIRFPDTNSMCGIQVPHEEHIRWINCSELQALSPGALIQNPLPNNSD